MKTLEKVISTLIEKDIKNRIIYTGYCFKCKEFFYTYATNAPAFCSKSCRFDNKHLTTDGYLGMYVGRKQVKVHRVAYEKEHGTIPGGYDIHHIDGNKLNNDLSNLVALTKSEHTKLHYDSNNS
jgi:hypothetical protein